MLTQQYHNISTAIRLTEQNKAMFQGTDEKPTSTHEALFQRDDNVPTPPQSTTLQTYQKLLCSNEVEIPELGKSMSNNIWLRLQAPLLVLSPISWLDESPELQELQNIKINLDRGNHTVSFVHEGETLCTQIILPHEEFLLQAIIAKNPQGHDSIIDFMKTLNEMFPETNACDLTPHDAEGGAEIHKLLDKEFFIYRRQGIICKIFAMPSIKYDGAKGAGKQVTHMDPDFFSAVILERTPEAINNIAQRGLTRKPSLTSEQIHEIVLLHDIGATSVYYLGRDIHGSERWISESGTIVRYTHNLRMFKNSAYSLECLHEAFGVHGDMKPDNIIFLPRNVVRPDASSAVDSYKYQIVNVANETFHPTADDFKDVDIVLVIYTKPDGSKFGKMFVKPEMLPQDKKLSLIAYIERLPNLQAELNAAKTEADAKNIVWKFKKHLILRGLPPSDEFVATILDWWRAISSHEPFAELSLDRRIDVVSDLVKQCFDTITQPYSVTSLHSEFNRQKQIFREKYKVFTADEANMSVEDKEDILRVGVQCLQIAQIADNFAFIVTLLETQGYNWHKIHSPQNTDKRIPLGLPMFHAEELQDEQYMEPYQVPNTARNEIDQKDAESMNATQKASIQESEIAVFDLNVDILVSFVYKHAKEEYRDQLFAFISDPVSYYNSLPSYAFPSVHEMIDWEKTTAN